MIIEKAKEVIQQQRQDAIESASYIKTTENRQKFLNKVNYQQGILEQLLEIAERDDECIEEKESPYKYVPKIPGEMSNQEYISLYGKEKKRTESLKQDDDREAAEAIKLGQSIEVNHISKHIVDFFTDLKVQLRQERSR